MPIGWIRQGLNRAPLHPEPNHPEFPFQCDEKLTRPAGGQVPS